MIKKTIVFILALHLLCIQYVYSENYDVMLDNFIVYANSMRDSIVYMYEDAQELVEGTEIPEDERVFFDFLKSDIGTAPCRYIIITSNDRDMLFNRHNLSYKFRGDEHSKFVPALCFAPLYEAVRFNGNSLYAQTSEIISIYDWVAIEGDFIVAYIMQIYDDNKPIIVTALCKADSRYASAKTQVVYGEPVVDMMAYLNSYIDAVWSWDSFDIYRKTEDGVIEKMQ